MVHPCRGLSGPPPPGVEHLRRAGCSGHRRRHPRPVEELCGGAKLFALPQSPPHPESPPPTPRHGSLCRTAAATRAAAEQRRLFQVRQGLRDDSVVGGGAQQFQAGRTSGWEAVVDRRRRSASEVADTASTQMAPNTS